MYRRRGGKAAGPAQQRVEEILLRPKPLLTGPPLRWLLGMEPSRCEFKASYLHKCYLPNALFRDKR